MFKFLFSPRFRRTLTPSRFKTLILILSTICNLYLLFRHPTPSPPPLLLLLPSAAPPPPPPALRHILFAVASSASSLPRRAPLLRLWFSPNSSTRAFLFLDRRPSSPEPFLPPVLVSADTSRFPYTFPRGLRSAIRVARIVKEAVDRGEPDVRWFVFGDDDTVFFTDNLVRVLSKYDHDLWYYIGGSSESYEQNAMYSFDMAFGGGGFAISRSLAVSLAGVFDSCLMRYSHLYGSDSRVHSCLVELGVGLTHEPGFHQIDIRGNLFGMLSAHPLPPLVSLHHLDSVDPIFPTMNRTQALTHLFEAINVDPARILQQTVCYDLSNSLTISVAWGYAIQVFRGNQLVPDLLSLQRTFMPWKRGKNVPSNYMFITREYPRDPCKRPAVFFFESISSEADGIRSDYSRHHFGSCPEVDPVQNWEKITVFTQKLEYNAEELKAPRRRCCNVLPSPTNSMLIRIRRCGLDELISMNS